MMKEKNIIITAQILSLVFTPFYLPLVGLASLFFFSYMSVLPLVYKIVILLMVYLFTILLPTLLIRLYRYYQGWTQFELGKKERRAVPYIISILCYFACLYIMECRNVPRYITIVLVSALLIQMVCAIVNIKWKVSIHTAAIGGITGALMAFAEIFAFNPIWWLCVLLMLSGIVGTCRMILRQHTLAEVCGGFAIGFIVAYVII